MADRFPSPFEMETPTGAEGWEELYGYSTVFSEDRKDLEDSMFWFMDGVHTPEVVPTSDTSNHSSIFSRGMTSSSPWDQPSRTM